MNEKQAINISIPVIYNFVFNEEPCKMKACTGGKCICMSEEQAGILRKYLCDDDTLGMGLHSGNIYFANLGNITEGVPKDWICDFDKEGVCFFYKNMKLNSSSEWNELTSMDELNISEFYRMVRNIPIIYVLNMKNTIDERGTLLGLCSYSESPERFMEILFQTIICTIIGFYKREKDSSKREQFTVELENLFHKMNALQKIDTKKEIRKDLCNSIDMYSEQLYQCSTFLERDIANKLMDYLRSIETGQRNMQGDIFADMDELEKEKFGYLYQIVKKLLELERIKTSRFPQISICIECSEHDEYMRILHILDCVKDDEKKKEKVLSELNIAFWKGVEIPSETIEMLEQYLEL